MEKINNIDNYPKQQKPKIFEKQILSDEEVKKIMQDFDNH